MSFGAAISSVLHQYATLSGRARRSEYWWYALGWSIAYVLLYVLGLAAVVVTSGTDPQAGGPGPALVVGVLLVFALATFLPSLAVSVRRLHDTGRSGWWYLLSFVPFGGIVLLVLAIQDSEPGTNVYGRNPTGVEPVAAAYGFGAPTAYGRAAQG